MKSCFIFLFLLLPSALLTQNSDWIYRNPYPQNDFYAVKFFNQNTGYVIGSGGVFLKNVSGSADWINIETYTNRDLFAMYFFDINKGYIAGDGGLILYTSNGGANWTSVATNNAYALRSVTFVNQNTGFIAGDNGELYKTTNGITGWQQINLTTKNLRNIFFYDTLRGYVCGDSGVFLKTTNCGADWTVQTLGNVNLQCVSFINAQTGFITEKPSGVIKTTDGGNSWNNELLYIQGEENYIKFADAFTGYVYGKNGPISRTTNGGLNWYTWCSSQLFFGNSFYDISPADSVTSYLCGAQGWILRCNDQQPSPYAVHLGGSLSPLSRISFTSSLTGAMMGDGSLLFTTSNGGNNWNISFCGSNSWFEGSSSLTGLWLFSSTSWYRKIYWPGIGGFSSTGIQQSTDGGVTWGGNRSYSTISLGVASIDVFETGGITYLTANSNIFKNSGAGWNTIYTGSSTGNIYFADANTGFVALYNSGVKSVLYTSNGGTNWINYSTGFTKWIESVYLSTSGLGFIGCDSALLLKTTNFGVNFTQIFVPDNLHVQNIKFVNDNNGWFLGTDHSYPGSGRLYVSNNGGESFQQLQSLMNFNVKGFSFTDALNGYVCGDSGRVLKTTNGGLTFTSQNGGIYPDNFSLSQNYPNPFNPVTNIRFRIPLWRGVSEGRGVFVKLTVYDLLGREVKTLINQQMQPGSYSVDWDASNFPSGVYFYKLAAEDYAESKKMVLIK